ncbi:DUF6630 family protein [Prescottella agglutinans]|uniref:DUF6630 family protein n=1 Tax=Prescottella agglutinans TaxID=1644129 RepID=UPI003D976902
MPDTQQIPQALSEIVELIAPGSKPSQARLAEEIAGRGVAGTWAPSSALFWALHPEGPGGLHEAGMTSCDWNDTPGMIRESLIELPACPAALNWDWLDEFDDPWDPEELENFLWPLAARCRELGSALIILDTGSDGYGIGFVSAEHIERIVKLAQIANCELRVVHPGVETFLV